MDVTCRSSSAYGACLRVRKPPADAGSAEAMRTWNYHGLLGLLNIVETDRTDMLPSALGASRFGRSAHISNLAEPENIIDVQFIRTAPSEFDEWMSKTAQQGSLTRLLQKLCPSRAAPTASDFPLPHRFLFISEARINNSTNKSSEQQQPFAFRKFRDFLSVSYVTESQTLKTVPKQPQIFL